MYDALGNLGPRKLAGSRDRLCNRFCDGSRNGLRLARSWSRGNWRFLVRGAVGGFLVGTRAPSRGRVVIRSTPDALHGVRSRAPSVLGCIGGTPRTLASVSRNRTPTIVTVGGSVRSRRRRTVWSKRNFAKAGTVGTTATTSAREATTPSTSGSCRKASTTTSEPAATAASRTRRSTSARLGAVTSEGLGRWLVLLVLFGARDRVPLLSATCGQNQRLS